MDGRKESSLRSWWLYLSWFKKASDSVSTASLQVRLRSYDITGKLHNLLTSFLVGISFNFKVKVGFSDLFPVISAIPKDACKVSYCSCYILMILPNCIAVFDSISVRLYVDDAQLSAFFCSSEGKANLQLARGKVSSQQITWKQCEKLATSWICHQEIQTLCSKMLCALCW